MLFRSPRQRADAKAGDAQTRHLLLQNHGVLLRAGQVRLVPDRQAGTLREPGPIGLELAADDPPVFQHVGLGQVHHVDQHPGPLHVTQKMEPQPLVLVRTLDQARDVGDDDLLVVDGLCAGMDMFRPRRVSFQTKAVVYKKMFEEIGIEYAVFVRSKKMFAERRLAPSGF